MTSPRRRWLGVAVCAPTAVLVGVVACGGSYGTARPEEQQGDDAGAQAQDGAGGPGGEGGAAGTDAASVEAGPDYPPGTCLSDVDGGCICAGANTICTIQCAKGPCAVICSGGATCTVTCNNDCTVMCKDTSSCNVKGGSCAASGASTCVSGK